MNEIIQIDNITKLSEALTYLDLSHFINQSIPIKLHMGEKQNKFFPRSEEVKHAVNALKQLPSQPFLFDTTVAYNAKRHTITGYLELAAQHGYSQTNMGCPIIIDDSGQDITVENHTYTVADHLLKATHIFAWSHVKGHIATGMGGAIKNFGMGGVTKETKLRMHHGSRPRIDKNQCTSCGICAEVCPFDAIEVTQNNWKKNQKSCFGCGVCVNNCPSGAMTYEDADLNYTLACAAYACVHDKNIIYLNDVNRIARSCDCDPNAGPTIAPDKGYLLGTDMVAIDQASVDLIYQTKPGIFDKEHHIDPYQQIKYGEKIGLGSTQYELVKI